MSCVLCVMSCEYSHYGAGVSALLCLAVSDQEGSVGTPPQQLFRLGPLQIAQVPALLIQVCHVLLLLLTHERAHTGENTQVALESNPTMYSKQAG